MCGQVALAINRNILFSESDDDKSTSDDPKPSTSTSKHSIQSGGEIEINEDIIDKISNLVSNKISARFPQITPNYRYYETSQPTVTSEVESESASAPIEFGYTIRPNDQNDQFDQQHLISLIPKLHKQKAIRLLQALEEQPQEITFNSKGDIFLNSQSLPGANIYVLFPALFKRRTPKALVGYPEFTQKLSEMKLTHFISAQSMKADNLKSSHTAHAIHQASGSGSKQSPWWYIGP